MRKNFKNGFLAGIFGTVIIFAIVLLGMNFIVRGRIEANGLSVPDSSVTNEEKEKESYTQIISKLTFLEGLVDNYYLEGIDDTAFADGIYKGFMSSLGDPYSTYYTKEEYMSLMESSSGVYHGIGATVSQDVKTGVITIVKPFTTGPAYQEGIKPGDIIYKVDGEEVTGLDLTEVVSRMKGKEGTQVTIEIARTGQSEPIEFVVTRQQIKVPTIEYKMLADKIGYILISEFDEITVSQFSSAITELESLGMKGLVVDVRNNPGGLLSSVVKMLDRLLPKGLIVYTEDKYGKRVEESATNPDKIDIPVTVIINGNSASASEIFAGAIQDYEIGTIVGTTSYGKGIVQKVFPLSDGTAVKLTISKYYTPKGRNIHGTGIVPDIEIDLIEELKQEVEIPVEKDNQLQEAIRVLKGQIQ